MLAISEEKKNDIYLEFAKKYNIPYVTGSDRDVLMRLIKGGELVGADHI